MTSPDDYVYKIDRVRTRYSKPEIVASLKQYATEHAVDSIDMRDYNAWPKRILSAETIRVRFNGSWGKALQESGLRSQRGGKLDLRVMVTAFKACWREMDSVPSGRLLDAYLSKHNYPFRAKSFENIWGGFQRLAKLIVNVENGHAPEEALYERAPHKRIRRPITLRSRTAVLKRHAHRCAKCGRGPHSAPPVSIHVDHIVPVSKGGDNSDSNLQVLCSDCNLGKGNSDD